MRKSTSKIVYVAGILLALAFTFSCSSGNDNGSGNSSSSVVLSSSSVPSSSSEEESSSSSTPSSSSYVLSSNSEPSSSSAEESSSSSMPSSSSAVLSSSSEPSSSSEEESSSSSTPSSSSSSVLSSSSLLVYNYCVFLEEKICLLGPMTICPASGTLSNSCPYSSSSIAPPSSSSIFVPSSSSVPPQSGIIRGEPVYYGGETYQTVVIGTQTWMAKNLNYNAVGSKCGNESGKLSDANTTICDSYGRLYDWATAMCIDTIYNLKIWGGSDVKHRGICPSSWHIPSNADWDKLYRYVDGSTGTSSYSSPTAGTKLKSASGWNSNNAVPAGTDNYGFAALPGGSGRWDGFIDIGYYGYWWSASELSNGVEAYGRIMTYGYEGANYTNRNKSYLYSVRCVKD